MIHDDTVRVGIGLSPDLIRLDRPRLAELVDHINSSDIDHVVVTDHVAFRGGRGQDGLAALHYLAGLGVGLYDSLDAVAEQWRCEREFSPLLEEEERQRRYQGWREAVARVCQSPVSE